MEKFNVILTSLLSWQQELDGIFLDLQQYINSRKGYQIECWQLAISEANMSGNISVEVLAKIALQIEVTYWQIQNGSKKVEGESKEKIQCYQCKKYGHKRKYCTNKPGISKDVKVEVKQLTKPEIKAKQEDFECFKCGIPDHRINNCSQIQRNNDRNISAVSIPGDTGGLYTSCYVSGDPFKVLMDNGLIFHLSVKIFVKKHQLPVISRAEIIQGAITGF